MLAIFIHEKTDFLVRLDNRQTFRFSKKMSNIQIPMD